MYSSVACLSHLTIDNASPFKGGGGNGKVEKEGRGGIKGEWKGGEEGMNIRGDEKGWGGGGDSRADHRPPAPWLHFRYSPKLHGVSKHQSSPDDDARYRFAVTRINTGADAKYPACTK